MKLYFGNHGTFKQREYDLRRLGTRRLISFGDHALTETLDYWKAPLQTTPPTYQKKVQRAERLPNAL